MRILGVYRVYTYRSRRGMVLITAIWIIIALTAVVLVLCREMVVENLTTKQHLSQAQADAAEIGVEQYCMSIVEQELITPGYKDSVGWEQRQIGNSYFWVMTYNVNDDEANGNPAYGLTDEASKVDINSWPVESLELLPGMSDSDYMNIPAEMVDWRDPDELVTITDTGGQGEESNDYLANHNYPAKNAPFESIDEVRLLDGVDDIVLYGSDTNHNGVLDPAEANNANPASAFDSSQLGIMPFITVYGVQATNVLDTTNTYMPTSPIAALNLTDTSGNLITLPIDINSTTAIAANGPFQNMLSQVLSQQKATSIRTRTAAGPSGNAQNGGGRGGAGGGAATNSTANIYTSVWQWAIALEAGGQMTQQDFEQIYPYVAANPPPNPNNSTTSIYQYAAKLNINTASKAALMCLPGFEEQDAESIIDQRTTMTVPTDANGVSQIENVAWLLTIGIDNTKIQQAGKYITGSSTIFSADIVTVSQDGRAFKRVKVVVDASTGTPRIVYRKDLSDSGWPLDPAIRDQLRKGELLSGSGNMNASTPGGRLSMGVH